MTCNGVQLHPFFIVEETEAQKNSPLETIQRSKSSAVESFLGNPICESPVLSTLITKWHSKSHSPKQLDLRSHVICLREAYSWPSTLFFL